MKFSVFNKLQREKTILTVMEFVLTAIICLVLDSEAGGAPNRMGQAREQTCHKPPSSCHLLQSGGEGTGGEGSRKSGCERTHLVSTPSNGGEESKVDPCQWYVGTGRAKITPGQPMWMAGYASRTAPFQEVAIDLWSKAILLQDSGGNQLLLVTLDLVGLGHGMSTQIIQAIQDQHQLHRSQIVLSTSHTHSGPVVGDNLRPMYSYQLPAEQQELILQYSHFLKSQIMLAVQQAFDTKHPVELKRGTGSASFATNRRANVEADVPKRRASGQLEGPVDHSVPVLVAYKADKSPLAIVFGYACHATVLSGYRISGDYPGYAQIELERSYPGCTAMFWAGCGADQNPLPRRTEELAEHYGQCLALAVRSVLLTHELQVVNGPAGHQYHEIPLKYATVPSREQLAHQLASENIYEKMRAQVLIEAIDSGQPLSDSYQYPVQSWQFADEFQWVFLGGEVVVDYSARIQSECLDMPVWVTAYANDVMAYIPSLRVLRAGGYEGSTAMVYYGLPSSWAETVEQDIIAEVHRQLIIPKPLSFPEQPAVAEPKTDQP
ncbi:MAG TPA: hypothetical protein DCF63_14540 [Planctomycetaceae bacterium]|nr:hypothetical protein [Planctomycetaceae bacterium]